MLLFLLPIWFTATTAMRVGKASPRLVDTISVLHPEQENHLSFFTKQKWLQHKVQARDPTRAEPWAELWNLIRMRDRVFSFNGVCTLWQWSGVIATKCEHCAALEGSRASSLCQEGCQEQCPGPGAVLHLPAGASRWISFRLCCGVWSQGWITDISVSWSATSKDLRMSEIPISTTEEGWFATVAWWKLGILGFPFWVQRGLTDSSAMVGDGTFPEHLAASSGSRGSWALLASS